MSNRRPRRLLKRVSLSLVTIVVVLLCAELAVRRFTDTKRPVSIPDPALGSRFVPSFEGAVYDEESSRMVHLRFNSIGFRGPEYSLDPPPGVRRIAFLGDSMIAAVAVEEEKTLVHRLQVQLARSHPSVEWQVMNFGVPGSSTGQELVLYRELVRDYAPDLVLVGFFTGNDLRDNHDGLTNKPRIYFDLDEEGGLVQLPFSTTRAFLSRWLNLYSRLYVWQRDRRPPRTGAVPLVHFDPQTWILSEVFPDEVGEAWAITERLLEELQRETEADGAQLGLVLIPCAQQVYRDLYEEAISLAADLDTRFNRDYPDQRLAALSERNGTWFGSFAEDLREATPAGSYRVEEEWVFLNGNGHLTESGNALGASALHRELTAARDSGPSLIDELARAPRDERRAEGSTGGSTR